MTASAPPTVDRTPEDYRYDAFISYRHVEPDRAWAQWLHGALETYRVPKKLASRGGLPRRVGRVFRDEEELPASSDLNNEIEAALVQSRYLIVVCSPKTPESRWVNREVERFREMGRHDRILALLVKGEPAESFPKAMVEIRRAVIRADGTTVDEIEQVEPLAADVRDSRHESQRYLRRMARLRIMAILLGVRFDDLRQREQERRARRLAYLGGLLAVLLVIVGGLAVFAFRQRDVAVRERGVAERQRQIAVEQKEVADAQRLRAESELAQNTLLQGDMLGVAGRWPEAKSRYADAEAMLTRLGMPPLAARLGLWDAARHVPPPLDTLTGHAEPVWCAAVSPDGKWLLSGGRDKTLRLWDLPAGRLAKSLDGAGETVSAVAFLPDGAHALSAGGDKTIKVWDLSTGTVTRTLAGHDGPIHALALLPDGRGVLSASGDGTVRRWDLESGQTTQTIRVGEAVHSLALSPDGGQFACGTLGGIVKLYDAATGDERRTIKAHDFFVSGVGFLPDAKSRPAAATGPATQPAPRPGRLVTTSFDRRLKVWDLETGKATLTADNLTAGISALAVVSADRALAANWDGVVKLWDLSTGSVVSTFTGHSFMIRGLALTPDHRIAASACDDKTLRLWDLGGGAGVRTLAAGNGFNVTGIALPPDGRTASVATAEGYFWRYDLATGQPLRRDGRFGNMALAAAFSPDGTRAVLAGLTGEVMRWDVTGAAGSPVLVLGKHDGMANCAAVSPDGRFALTGGDKAAKRWDLEAGKEAGTVPHPGQVNTVGFSPDGRTAFSVCTDGLRVWDAATGGGLRTVGPTEANPATSPSAAAFSPDGTLLLVGTRGGAVRLYDPSTGREVRAMVGSHAQYVAAVAFGRDGKLAASASDDGTARLWDVATGRLLRTLTGHVGRVTGVAFAADGRGVLTGGTDGTARWWDFADPERVAGADAAFAAAKAKLAQAPDDAAALAAAGTARADRGATALAADDYRRAAAAGGKVPALPLARVGWQLGNLAAAVAEFRRAMEQGEAPGDYLRLCIAAVEGDITANQKAATSPTTAPAR